MNEDIRLGDSGKFLITCMKDGVVLDVSGPDVERTVSFLKKDGTYLTETLSLETDGTDGKVYFRFLPDYIDVLAEWKWQVLIVFSATEKKHSQIGKFTVGANLEAPTP